MIDVHKWRIVIFAVLAATVPALSGCAESTEPEADRGPTAAELVAQADAAPTPQLAWAPCTEPELSRYQCATAAVPLDYARPEGPKVELAVIRQLAGDPAARIGTLFTAAGGPGGSGLRAAGRGELLDGELARRFDVVTFDQRGIGRSAQIRCFPNPAEQERFWLGMHIPPANADQERADEQNSRALATGCATHDGDLTAHLTTADAARDLDLLRRAVGDPKLTYEGGSYASYLGEVYGALFGDRVRALQLVAMIDPAAYTTDTRTELVDTAVGTEEVLGEFLRLCAQAGPKCAFTGTEADLRVRDNALLDRLRRDPIVVGQGEQALAVTYGEVVQAHALMLYDPKEGWPGLAQLLAELERGATGNAETVREILSAGALSYDFLDSFTAISCADNTFERQPDRWPELAREAATAAPVYGPFWLYMRQPCAAWPAPADGYPQRYTGPWTLRSEVPALLFNNRYDPVTPLPFAERAQQALGNARLVVITDGYGHSPVSTCVAALRERYLLDLELPAPGTTCTADQPPFTQ